VRDRLARAGRADAADEVIELLARQAADVSERVHDPESTTFAWVTLAERLSIAESEDGVAALARDGIAVGTLVVNRILLDGGPCPICGPRRRDEIRLLRDVQRSWSGTRRVTVVPAMLQEPRGQPALRIVGAYLSGRRTVPASALRLPRVRSRWSVSESAAGSRFRPESIAEAAGARTIFVAGKGGVGKTTVAAALALRLAAARPRESILLLSTDPAHSLADVLDAPVGDRSARIGRAPANLVACELDAVRAFRHKRESIETALGQLSGAAPAAARLLDLAPPGIDELFGVMALVEARAAHDVIVVDTAPTGHALRLLAMPDAAREWTRALLRLMLKYRDVVRPGPLAEELVGASRSIRALQTSIRDPDATRFVVVTRAARLPMAETVRLLSRLRALKIAPAALVFNARTLWPRGCTRCRTTARLERLQMAELRRPRDCAIIQTPLVAPPPRGASALSRWAQSWTADES
jgi:arsenite-transporting ATPase